MPLTLLCLLLLHNSLDRNIATLPLAETLHVVVAVDVAVAVVVDQKARPRNLKKNLMLKWTAICKHHLYV